MSSVQCFQIGIVGTLTAILHRMQSPLQCATLLWQTGGNMQLETSEEIAAVCNNYFGKFRVEGDPER